MNRSQLLAKVSHIRVEAGWVHGVGLRAEEIVFYLEFQGFHTLIHRLQRPVQADTLGRVPQLIFADRDRRDAFSIGISPFSK